MEDITVPKGDYGYDLTFTVNDSSGTAYPLSGYTITLKVWNFGVSGTLLISSACTPVVAASGTCKYTVKNEDFDTVGVFDAELELTQTGKVESVQPFNITVAESG